MSTPSAQNAYDKNKVIQACDKCLAEIAKSRELAKHAAFSGKKEYWLFGRELTVEEAFMQGSETDRCMVLYLHGRQEMTVRRMRTAASLVAGDTVSLTNEEISEIAGYWDVV